MSHGSASAGPGPATLREESPLRAERSKRPTNKPSLVLDQPPVLIFLTEHDGRDRPLTHVPIGPAPQPWNARGKWRADGVTGRSQVPSLP